MSASAINIAHNHWNSLAQASILPHRRQLDPLDIPHLLSFSCLVECLCPDDGSDILDFRYNLVGGLLQLSSAPGLTGKKLSEIENQSAPSRIHTLFTKTVLSRSAGFGLVEYCGIDPNIACLDIGVFPFSTQHADRVSILWCVIDLVEQAKR